MNTLTVVNVEVRQDTAGRYSLNDLHRAAGGEDRHQPSNWLRVGSTSELIDEWLNSSDLRNCVQPVESIQRQGTYAVRELVYAYAMWISPAFHLRVIRAYDALVTGTMPTTRTPVAEVDEDWQRASKIRAAKTTFVAIVQVTRAMGMHHSRSLAAANRASIRHHGVDMIEETQAQDLLRQTSLPGAASGDSVSTFLFELTSGTLGLELVPCLATDLDLLYRAWCRRNRSRAFPIMRLVHCARREFHLPTERKRYLSADGGIHGPASMVFLGGDVEPPEGVGNTQWHGASIARFREQLAQFEATDGAIARAA